MALGNEKMDEKDFKEEYERKLCKRRIEARLIVEKGVSVNKVSRVFKDAVIAPGAAEMIGYRPLRVQKKGNAWWTDGIQ